ncbi:molybdopterin molybdotransferase MoeA [Arthrobacter roseus]|uniref:molybdopterin molybdotransferase MoeA n=1 Tax=Arthrobacter roseus TaxID=136274 RepID=UPI001966648F|nr:molybdopterin molybdotransferase MoeA [Arthrobacter roseus]MBM7847761.1 molybdopterin molybdotransferase [Arthrobacter roseus]
MTASSWPYARIVAYSALRPLEPKQYPLAACVGAAVAEDVHALGPMPHYASSAMDGWAVTGDGPWRLQEPGALSPGVASTIITGAPIPQGATAVLRSESGTVTDGILSLNSRAKAHAPWAGQHIRPEGTEASAGELLIPQGTILTPAWVAVAAGATRDELCITRMPVVDLVSTGDEVIAEGTPSAGQVRDTFSLLLPDAVRGLGARTRTVLHVPDDSQQLTAALLRPGADVVITTGGTGTSSADHLREVLATLGANVIVHSIAMRPGHPALLALLPDGRAVVGLPGNPLAAMMALLTLAGPLIARLAGRPQPETRSSVSALDVTPLPGRHRLLPAKESADGVTAVERIGSGMLRGLATADCVLVVPPEGLVRGATAQVMHLPW